MGLLRTLHGWCGALLAFALALIAFTGAASVFSDDVARFCAPKAAASATATDAFALGGALQAFEGRGGGAVRAVEFTYGPGVHRVYLQSGGGAFIDSRGAAIRSWAAPGYFDEWILSLHNQFLLGDPGGRLVGLAGLAAFAMGLSGLVLFLPAWRGFAPRLWPATGARRDLIVVHKTLGVFLLIPLLVQTATGAAMAFEGPLRHGLGLDGAPPPLQAQGPVAGPAPWTRVLQAAERAAPGAKILGVSKPWGVGEGIYKVEVSSSGAGETTLMIDASVGRALAPRPVPRRGLAAQVMDGLLAVHSGAWGGLPARIALALAAVGLGATSLVGAWSFVLKRRRVRKSV